MMAKDLGPIAFSSVRFQSALVHCVAQNRSQHFSRCGHAILADRVAVKLQRQFDIAVAKQSLYGLWIGSDANQKRRLLEIALPLRFRLSTDCGEAAFWAR
jgi:hypothetical protein